jgi:hypothetical protein
MFSGCAGLREVIIPPSVTKLGNHAFLCCTALTQVAIPASVKEIGNRAFSGCTGLAEVSLPAEIAKIGRGAFEIVKRVKKLVLVGSNLTQVVVDALLPCLTPDATVVGPELTGRDFGPFTIVAA